MKKAYIVVMWDMSDDSETVLNVYLSKLTAEAAIETYKANDIKWKREGVTYFLTITDLIED
jgi:hypothetical protein